MTENVLQYLRRHNIPFIEHKHPAFFTVEESSKHDFGSLTKTKSLFLKSELGQFYLITLRAENRLPVSFLRKHLNVKSLEFATPQELFSQLKVRPGSVSIFCVLNNPDVHLIVDFKILSADSVGFHPNENTSTLELNKSSFSKFYGLVPNKKEIIDLG